MSNPPSDETVSSLIAISTHSASSSGADDAPSVCRTFLRALLRISSIAGAFSDGFDCVVLGSGKMKALVSARKVVNTIKVCWAAMLNMMLAWKTKQKT